MVVKAAADPHATIAALDERVRAVILDIGSRAEARCRREQNAVAAAVVVRRRDGGRVTAAWLAEQPEYRALVVAFSRAWADLSDEATMTIGLAQAAAARLARRDAAALLGEPVTASGAGVDRRAVGAVIAEIGGDVARALVAELVRG